jgi:uncharacterized protein involved in outer membrane biogenesis
MLKKIGIIIVVLFVLVMVRDLIIKQVVISVASSALGAPVKIGGLSLGLLTRHLEISNINIENPEGFSKNSLIDIAHVKVTFHPIDILTGKMYFDLIDLNIRQLAIEKNTQGQFNVSSLKIQPQQKNDKPLNMHIDVLRLNVDKVTLRDASQNNAAKEVNRGVGLHQKEFKNINSPQQLVALVLFESSGLGPLKNIALSATKEVLTDVSDLTKGMTGEAKKTANSLFKSIKSAVDK